MPQQLVIVIRPGGTTEVKAEGFQGRGCLAATKFLETALGRVQADRKAPEFYAAEPSGVEVGQHLQQ
jgi:hypothetical protein